MSSSVAMVWAEGRLDRVAAMRLLDHLGLSVTGPVADAGGEPGFWAAIAKYNQAAKYCGLVFALADHDEAGCIGPKIAARVPDRHPNLILRLSVMEIESWLLADSGSLAEHLQVAESKIPKNPDSDPDPKRTIVNLARRYSRTALRVGMVPAKGRSVAVGPEYSLIMEEFINVKWRPDLAARRSPSLQRAIEALVAAVTRSAGGGIESVD